MRVVAGIVLVAAVLGLAAWGIWSRGGGSPERQLTRGREPVSPGRPRSSVVRRRQVRLVEQPTGELAAPLQDAAAAPIDGRRVLLLGGLTAADTSSDGILVTSATSDSARGRLPAALHDAAAVRLDGSSYLFGGGNGRAQLDEIVRVDPANGRTASAGRLPAPSSDQAAATIGGTAYVVGGFTGTRWLDTIVAWRPGTEARVVARLPGPLRYAAVAASDGRLIIAGGSTPAGTASSAVLAFDPRTARISPIGRLPAPTTHAAAASLRGIAYVIGGRGALVGTLTARIFAVDARAGRVRFAGTLATPRSDLAATRVGSRILLVGGRGLHGTVTELSELQPAGGRKESSSAAARTISHSARVNVYAADRPGLLAAPARRARPLVYVPNSESGTVDEIDPRTYRVVRNFPVGSLPQHVTPAYDLKTLYVLNDRGNSLTPIDPVTGRPRKPIPVDDPYNMYFTPDGRYAIVVAERLGRLDFRDAHSFRLHRSLPVPCAGIDHMDFSADGRYALASCEFSGQLLELDVRREKVVRVLTLAGGHAMPQDVKLSPDGAVFYVADMMASGLWEVDAQRFKLIGFLRTGRGVHGLYPSRDAKLLYATNRGEGSISVISFARRKVIAKWRLPGGGSPDMGGVSADGKVLWLSGRYNSEVYAISTRSGRLLARIPVGRGPHGLCVWPQPGRYSLGHTGILR